MPQNEFELRPREIEILNLVSEGNSYKHVARILDLSLPTIKVYIGRAKEKMGAKSICHAIALWVSETDE